MDWYKIINSSIQYIEDNILEDINADLVAQKLGISSNIFQKGFYILCGCTVSEYIRKRRLSLAGNDVLASDLKIIDIAVKYGYESPDSFTKAFTKFHKYTPSEVRKHGKNLKSFAKLRINWVVAGGNILDYHIERKKALRL